jgi:hypothetical protein
MELRDLRCFVVVAEELSFSRAAQRLYMTQPPLRARVKHLEEELGVALAPASHRNLQTTSVVYRPVQGSAPTVEMGVVWRRDDPGVVLNTFLKVVTEVFRDLQNP